MNINVIRKIDTHLGSIVCRVLLALRNIARPRPLVETVLPLTVCRSVLVVKFFGMGTILLASPALRVLKQRYAGSKITMLTLSTNRELCRALPSVDDVICLRIDSLSGFLISFGGILRTFTKQQFDVVIDLEFLTNFSAMVTVLATLFTRPEVTVGFNSPLRWRNNTHDINVAFDHSRHITKIFSKVVRSLGIDEFEYSFKPERTALLSGGVKGFIPTLKQAHGALKNCTRFVCLNINTGDLCLHRRWPKEYFSEIVNGLLKKPEMAVILIGGKTETSYVNEFAAGFNSLPRVVNLCGETGIWELAGLFAGADLLITNDSGPLHLAGIIGLPTISFFGPETPYLYGPFEDGHYVFYDDLHCSPCLNIYNSKMSHCTNNLCLKNIKPGQVLEVIERRFLFS